MSRHFAFLISWLIATVLGFCLLLSQPRAEEEQTVLLSGKLTGYDTRSVTVDGEHIDLCDNVQVLDSEDRPILTDGLVATETVAVVLTKGCAIEVKALEIRK